MDIHSAIKVMKTGKVVKFNGAQFWCEFDDNGDLMIETSYGDIISKDEFINRFEKFQFKVVKFLIAA